MLAIFPRVCFYLVLLQTAFSCHTSLSSKQLNRDEYFIILLYLRNKYVHAPQKPPSQYLSPIKEMIVWYRIHQILILV